MFVNVALNIPSDKTFTYEVPADLQNQIEIGKRVFVPFGNKKRTGFIVEINQVKQKIYLAEPTYVTYVEW